MNEKLRKLILTDQNVAEVVKVIMDATQMIEPIHNDIMVDKKQSRVGFITGWPLGIAIIEHSKTTKITEAVKLSHAIAEELEKMAIAKIAPEHIKNLKEHGCPITAILAQSLSINIAIRNIQVEAINSLKISKKQVYTKTFID